MSLNSREEDSDHLSKLQEQNGEEYKDAAVPLLVPLLCSGKNLNAVSTLSTLALYLSVAFHHQNLQALIVSLAKACPSPSLI